MTHIASCTSALVWIGLSWKRAGKPSSTAPINGAISGLAGVTPASGFISAQNSFLLGIVLGFASYYAILLLKEHLKIDDALDVSSVHGVTGIVGALAIGLIASTFINPAGPDGLLYGNPMQLAVQAFGVAVAGSSGFGGTHHHHEDNRCHDRAQGKRGGRGHRTRHYTACRAGVCQLVFSFFLSY